MVTPVYFACLPVEGQEKCRNDSVTCLGPAGAEGVSFGDPLPELPQPPISVLGHQQTQYLTVTLSSTGQRLEYVSGRCLRSFSFTKQL